MAEWNVSALGGLSGECLASLRLAPGASVAELKRLVGGAGPVKLFHEGQQIFSSQTLAEAGLRIGSGSARRGRPARKVVLLLRLKHTKPQEPSSLRACNGCSTWVSGVFCRKTRPRHAPDFIYFMIIV
ncbi:unnamed protein product [Durusdinium trenchii]|uniref:Ubiquitin-like domain-containing protein n=1 Tax=Durusdinium trenchii TaxID=1381693 RepID=A0ABP0NQL4_9DINO